MLPELPLDAIARLCRKYRVSELAGFGSTLRDGEGHDLDLLVTFEPGARIGFEFVRLQRELAEIVGRPVDLVPKDALKLSIRDRILSEAVTVYAAATAVPG